MQNWLRRQNSWTKWTAIGTAISAAAGMVAVATLVIALITAYTVGQCTYFGIAYPPVLDEIAKAALYIIGASIVGFLISAVCLIISLFVGTKPTEEQAQDYDFLGGDQKGPGQATPDPVGEKPTKTRPATLSITKAAGLLFSFGET